MKRLIFTSLILFLGFSFFSCKSTVSISENQIPNHQLLTEDNIGETVTITGVLQRGEGNFFTIENASNKNAVNFIIYVPDEMLNQCEELVYKKITMEGILVAAPTKWKKEIDLVKIK